MPGKYCFIIGPMFDQELLAEHLADPSQPRPRLQQLADNVIGPILNMLRPGEYRVETPYSLPPGNIMNKVIAAIDRAELVIADMTGYNPNVFYEMAIAHALGIASLAVREKPSIGDKDAFPFDLSAYRYYDITIERPAVAIQLLIPALQEILKQIDNHELFDSPVKAFYKEPITNISPAAGIAQGYFQNFIKPVIRGLNALSTDVNQHLFDLSLLPQSVVDRRAHKLEIIIPSRLEYTGHRRVTQLKEKFGEIAIPGERREMKVFVRKNEQTGIYHLLDVPTTMNTMEAAIEKRLDTLNPNPSSNEWKEIESREVDRFQLEVEQWIAYEVRREQDFSFGDRVVIRRFNPDIYDPNLDWLFRIWQSHNRY